MKHPKPKVRRWKLYRRKILKYNNKRRWYKLFGFKEEYEWQKDY